MLKRFIASIACITFIFSNFQYIHAQEFSINQLPVPGAMVGVSKAFTPLVLKGLVVNPQKPLEFQFIVDTGKGSQDTASIKEESNTLVKYFLAGLTIPEGDLWVNLSPYEKDRITTQSLGQTELGRDLLAQDYILKQLTASLIYPEKDLGKEFWQKVYTQAQKQFGTTNIPVNTFNKVWILPDQAQIFENGSAVYVTKSTLKVMLDEDYLAKGKHQATQASSVSSAIVRQIVLPEIEKEVNTGKNFASLRQIYDALILAKWYKETIQNGLLDAVYTNKNKTAGVNLNNPAIKQQIYDRYLQAYKKGVFNYIKEDITLNGKTPRKYFSGGLQLMPKRLRKDGAMSAIKGDGVMLALRVKLAKDSAMTASEAHKRITDLLNSVAFQTEEWGTRIWKDIAIYKNESLITVAYIPEGPNADQYMISFGDTLMFRFSSKDFMNGSNDKILVEALEAIEEGIKNPKPVIEYAKRVYAEQKADEEEIILAKDQWPVGEYEKRLKQLNELKRANQKIEGLSKGNSISLELFLKVINMLYESFEYSDLPIKSLNEVRGRYGALSIKPLFPGWEKGRPDQVFLNIEEYQKLGGNHVEFVSELAELRLFDDPSDPSRVRFGLIPRHPNTVPEAVKFYQFYNAMVRAGLPVFFNDQAEHKTSRFSPFYLGAYNIKYTWRRSGRNYPLFPPRTNKRFQLPKEAKGDEAMMAELIEIDQERRQSFLFKSNQVENYMRTETNSMKPAEGTYYSGTVLDLIERPVSDKVEILRRQKAIEQILVLTPEQLKGIDDTQKIMESWISSYLWLTGDKSLPQDKSEQMLVWLVSTGKLNSKDIDQKIKSMAGKIKGREWKDLSDEEKTYVAFKQTEKLFVQINAYVKAIKAIGNPLLTQLAEEIEQGIKKARKVSAVEFVQLAEAKNKSEISQIRKSFHALRGAIINLDAFFAFAHLVKQEGYSQATFDEAKPAYYKEGWNFLELKKAKEPYWGEKKGKDQVPNDSPVDKPVIILTGSNMSGKSFQLKQMLYIQKMSQAFGYVPAKEANLHIYDHMVYLDRASTDSFNNLSSFGKEIANIIPVEKALNENTLVSIDFADEGFSTTSPEDQADFLIATQRFFESKGVKFILATHNDEYIDRNKDNPNVVFYHLEVKINGNDISYTHRLTEGIDDSRALDVAKALGLQQRIIDRAKDYMNGTPQAVNDIRPSPTIPIARYTPEERQDLKTRTGNFLAFFPQEDVVEVHPKNEFDSDRYSKRGQFGWYYKSRLAKAQEEYREKYEYEPKERRPKFEPEQYPFDPVFRPFTQDQDFRSYGLSQANLKGLTGVNALEKISNLLLQSPSRDPKDIYERQRLFEVLLSPEGAKIREAIGDLWDNMVYLSQRDIKIEFERFNLQLLESSAPQKNYFYDPKKFKASREMFEAILAMNLRLAGKTKDDLDISQESEQLKELDTIRDELKQLSKESDEFYQSQAGSKKDWYKSTYKPKRQELRERLAQLKGVPVDQIREYYGQDDIDTIVSEVLQKIITKASKIIPPVSLYDRQHWKTIQEMLTPIYKMAAEQASHNIFGMDKGISGQIEYLHHLLSNADTASQFTNLLRSQDSVYLHQWANYFEKLLSVYFEDLKPGQSLLDKLTGVYEKVKEVDAKITKYKQQEQEINSKQANLTALILDSKGLIEKEIGRLNEDKEWRGKHVKADSEDSWEREQYQNYLKLLDQIEALEDLLAVSKGGPIDQSKADIMGQQFIDLVLKKQIGYLEEERKTYTIKLESPSYFFSEGDLTLIIEELSKFNSLYNLTKIIKQQNWKPVELTDKPELEFTNGWNLAYNKDEYEDNMRKVHGAQKPLSMRLDDQQRVRLYSGSTMSGKTFAEKTLIWQILAAQATGFAPNAGMRLPVFSRLFYFDRITTQFDRTLSSFGHEVKYWASFLNMVDKEKGLVLAVADEAGSTTSPRYQEALSYVLASDLLAAGHFFVMSSHNHRFLDRFTQLNGNHTRIYHFKTRLDEKGDVIFDHEIEEGHAPSNSRAVAHTLGLRSIVDFLPPKDDAMSTQQKIVLPNDTEVTMEGLGEKPEKLIKLKKAGFRVPKFFVVKSNGTGKLDLNDSALRKAFDSIQKPVIVRSAHPQEGKKYSYSGIFASFENVSLLTEAEVPVQEVREEEWWNIPSPQSVEKSYEAIVAGAEGSQRSIEYRKALNISDFDPNSMNIIVMEQIDVEVFGMFVTSDTQNPKKTLIHYQIREEGKSSGGIISYDKETHALEDNRLDDRIKRILVQFGETAANVEKEFGVQQIELGSARNTEDVYVFQSRTINLGNPNDAPRLTQYQTLSQPRHTDGVGFDSLRAIGYGSYRLPIMVIESIEAATGYRDWPEYRESERQWSEVFKLGKDEAEKDVIRQAQRRIIARAKAQYQAELLAFQAAHPQYILVLKDGEIVQNRGDGGGKDYNFLNGLISKAKVVIKGRNQNAIRHEDWDHVDAGGITILLSENDSLTDNFNHKGQERGYVLQNIGTESINRDGVLIQWQHSLATGDFLNVLSNVDGVFVWYDKNAHQDNAQIVLPINNGGIDLNQINVNRTGKTINIQFDPAQLNELLLGGFEGFSPVIISITPINNLYPLLGLKANESKTQSLEVLTT